MQEKNTNICTYAKKEVLLQRFRPPMDKISKAQIKLVRSLQHKKFRDELGLFVAEGEKCVEELRKGFELVLLVESQESKVESGEIDPLRAYSEEPHLGLWLTGNKTAQSWVRREEKTTFYLLRAYVNAILTRLGVDVQKTTVERLENELFQDGLTIKAQNGKALAIIGIVARRVLKQLDVDQEVFFADLDWKALLKQNKQYKAVINDLPKFPEVKRDFALLVDKSVEFADLARTAFETEKKLLKNVYLFDVYEGKNLEEGKKSYALSFILQDAENTLKDTQIENIMNRLKAKFEEKFNATLR